MRCITGDKLESQCAHATLPSHLDGFNLATRHPQWRVWLLFRFGQHVTRGKVEPLAVKLPRRFSKHRDDTAHRLFPDFTLITELAVERVKFGDASTLADTHLDPPS